MALVSISTLTPRVAIYAKGCPNPIIERALMDAARELCEFSGCWRVVTTFSTTSGVYEYNFPSLPANTEISHPITQNFESGYLWVASPEYIQAFYPTWPDTTTDALAEPKYLTFITPTKGWLAPVPDDAYDLKFIISIKPSHTASQIEELVLNENVDALVHGAVHKLRMQKEYDWFDPKDAIYHGKQYKYFSNLGRAKVNKGFTRADLVVAVKPFA